MLASDFRKESGMSEDEREIRRRMLDVMTAEHFVLQTARAATIQEANQRAELFLTSVSSATIALAFVAQVTQMGGPFVLFSLILLPCVYFIGLVTFVRAVQVAIEDMMHARGMARIRHYYVELIPPAERYLVHTIHDDGQAVLANKGLRASRWQGVMSTAGMVNVVDAAIAGVLVGVFTRSAIGWSLGPVVVLGAMAFAASAGAFEWHHARAWSVAEQALPPRFPRGRAS
jgi:hypothetical protein